MMIISYRQFKEEFYLFDNTCIINYNLYAYILTTRVVAYIHTHVCTTPPRNRHRKILHL